MGCKDGSVIALDLWAASERDVKPLTLRSGPESGVRWIYDLHENSGLDQGSLLIGDDLGKLLLLEWKAGHPAMERLVAHRPEDNGEENDEEEWLPIILIEAWNEETFLISYRDRDVCLFPRVVPVEGLLRPISSLPGIQGVIGIMHCDGKETLLICESGELWGFDPATSTVKAYWNCCAEREQPGFVSDSVPVVLTSEGGGRQEILFLSTDTGLYQLYWEQRSPDGPRGENSPEKPKIEKVHLPGITGMCMAVSYLETPANSKGEKLHYLWVSDLAGDVHMFWQRSTGPLEEFSLYWERFGFRLESSQATRSIASVAASQNGAFAICQACRNEMVVVTWYEELSPLERMADLLAWGTLADLERWTGIPGESKEQRWCPEARLAACIEDAGREPDHFARFLASPYPERLAWGVLQTIGVGERARQAVLLWTDALLGTIHRRMGDRREQQCLGVVRWLRLLAERCRDEDTGEWTLDLVPTIETSIRHARKWGVFGDTYSQREEVFAPLRALENKQLGDRRLESIAYEALLFGRRLDVEDEKPERPRGNRIPWDVQFLDSAGKAGSGLVAVSWRGGGVELYRLAPRFEGSAKGIPELELLSSILSQAEAQQETGPSDLEYDRSLALKPLPGNSTKAYLLRSTTKAVDPDADERTETEHFEVSLIDLPSARVESTLPGGKLPIGESLYSLEEMAPGLLAAGLRGINGKARLALVRLDEHGAARLVRRTSGGSVLEFLELPSAYPELGHVKLNPILSLACAAVDGESNRFDVVAGCGDGQIWKVRLHVEGTFGQVGEPVLVGRLGASVRALAYPPDAEEKELRATRVIAGGADGMIVAFQRVKDEEASHKEIYATLWATREQTSISRIHAFDRALDEEVGRLVLAVTESGMAVLFSDREKIKTSRGPVEPRPHRAHVPGQRLGRFQLGSTAFASTLVWTKEIADRTQDQRAKGRVVRLLVATGEGTLRLLTLHYPKYTETRHDQFEQIRKDWTEISKDGGKVLQGPLLRRAEALYAATPYLATLLVRWVLSIDWGGQPTDGSTPRLSHWSERAGLGLSEPIRQWLPWHLQSLVDLDAAWVRLVSGAEEPGDLELLTNNFTGALRAAREARDSRLFKEIVEVALNRANRDLFQRMRGFVEASRAGTELPDIRSRWFIRLLKCLKDVKGAWLGAPEDLDTRIRVVIARNVLDGDTLWSLSEALRVAPEGKLKERLQRLVQQQVELFHNFLVHGEPLLSLEVLRAVNFSLARACRRMKPEEELHQDAIEGFFETIGEFASRAVHAARNDLGEALAHELWRSYALGMVASPSLTLRLTHRMSEADLPIEFAVQVDRQFVLLSQLVDRSLPATCRKIFAIASGLRMQRGEEDYKASLLGEQMQPKDLQGDNRDLYLQGKLFDDIVVWLHQLAEQFLNEADNVNLEYSSLWLGLCENYKDREDRGERVPFRHSAGFWVEALKDLRLDLEREIKTSKKEAAVLQLPEITGEEKSFHESRPNPVRPELVLFSATLSEWCWKQRRRLDASKAEYRIFDPQRMIYDRALARLGRITAGFREGSALQKNMVLGVLGHGLLEMLDEHLLVLWEVAQALDPEQTWKSEDREKRSSVEQRTSRKQQFADSMLNTAFKAEVIPKNLRNLQWLLCYRTEKLDPSPGRKGKETLQDLLRDYEEVWDVENRGALDLPLKVDESHFLRFILNELQDNQGHNLRTPPKPLVAVQYRDEKDEKTGQVWRYPSIDFTFYCDEDKLGRIMKLVEVGLQEPVDFDPNSYLRSHGTGLYLANLAAAAVGWELGIGLASEKGSFHLWLWRRDKDLL